MNNNLNTFKILFLIKGILTLVFSLFFILYASVGSFFMNIDEFQNHSNQVPFNPGIIFLYVGIIGFIFSVSLGVIALLASKFIKEQRNYSFIFVSAILNGLTGILGIILAIFTIIEITKPEVKQLFKVN